LNFQDNENVLAPTLELFKNVIDYFERKKSK